MLQLGYLSGLANAAMPARTAIDYSTTLLQTKLNVHQRLLLRWVKSIIAETQREPWFEYRISTEVSTSFRSHRGHIIHRDGERKTATAKPI